VVSPSHVIDTVAGRYDLDSHTVAGAALALLNRV